jgi:lipoate-protein ligase A
VTRPGGRWQAQRRTGRAADHHARTVAEPAGRTVVRLDVDAPAVVLGSTQPDVTVDAARAAARGFDVVRRRSGGGAVLVEPGELLWVDVVVPSGDPLWDDDVGRAFHWLGDAWASALRGLGVDASAHTGALVTSRWSRLVCFAGLGPGEVTARPSGAKVVGIAQRRTRDAARFQCAVHVGEWRPEVLLDLLALDDAARRAALDDLRDVAVPAGVAADRLWDALLAQLE